MKSKLSEAKMARPEKRKLERVRYWQGQMLRSRDFRDLEAVEAQRRWWHNRALHSAYGVYDGLEISAVISSNNILTAVSIQQGLAYDCFGRELILQTAQVIRLPANPPASLPASLLLLIRYRAPAGDLRASEIGEVCWTQMSSLSAGTAELFWKPRNSAAVTDGVPLAEVDYNLNGVATLKPEFVPIPSQALARPLVASGTTLPGNTAWEPWGIIQTITQTGQAITDFGVQTTIDTSAAGFTATPCYFAWLEGSLWSPQTGQLVPAIFPSLTDESSTEFTFRLWFPNPEFAQPVQPVVMPLVRAQNPTFQLISDPASFIIFARQQGLYVSWLGCQMPPTVPFVQFGQRLSNVLLLKKILFQLQRR